ncbi:MAG: amidohydrolase family protein [Rubrivivax sp.]
MPDFWSWRERMYRVALRITPAQLRAVAATTTRSICSRAATRYCEFHYLQHREDGSAYDDPLALCWVLADAAADSGIGLTLLPVLYERAGFPRRPRLREDQRRFRVRAGCGTPPRASTQRSGRSSVRGSRCIRCARPRRRRSMRCARSPKASTARSASTSPSGRRKSTTVSPPPARPIEWLAREGHLDARWQLVHATHTTRAEIDAVARSGAAVVICPSTEGNLGDGLADLPGWLEAGVPIAIGSDGHVGRDWPRRATRSTTASASRCASAASPRHRARRRPSTAARRFDEAMRAGGAAAGQKRWGLVVGARADALMADARDPALAGVPPERWLGTQIFSAPARPWRDVMVAGRWVIRDGVHPQGEAIAARFAERCVRCGTKKAEARGELISSLAAQGEGQERGGSRWMA